MRSTHFICCTRKHSTGLQRQYTMQSSITDVCSSHAACTEQRSPHENTCTTVWPASLFFKSKFNTSWESMLISSGCSCFKLAAYSCHVTVGCGYSNKTLSTRRDPSSVDYIYIHIRNQVIWRNPGIHALQSVFPNHFWKYDWRSLCVMMHSLAMEPFHSTV